MRKGDLVMLRAKAGPNIGTVFVVTAVKGKGDNQQIKAESIRPPKVRLSWSSASAFVQAPD